MLIGSFLLLLVGAGLLIAGLAVGSNGLLVSAIVASLVAAVCLYAASRRASSAREERRDDRPRQTGRGDDDARLRDREALRDREPERRAPIRDEEPPRRSGMFESDPPAKRNDEPAYEIEVDSGSDEPPEVPMSSVEAAALMRMDTEVMVVDGRPRFHLGGCVHLVGRDFEPLPAYEAVELGFTACSLCRPAQSLLGEPTRH